MTRSSDLILGYDVVLHVPGVELGPFRHVQDVEQTVLRRQQAGDDQREKRRRTEQLGACPEQQFLAIAPVDGSIGGQAQLAQLALQKLILKRCRAIGHLADADIGFDEVGPPRREDHPEKAPMGMADQEHLVLPQPRENVRDYLLRIVDQLAGAERARVDVGMKRLSRPPLVPVNHHKVLLERPLERVAQVHRGHSRTAVQEEQDRGIAISAAEQDVLPIVIDGDGFELRDAVLGEDRHRVGFEQQPDDEHRREPEDDDQEPPHGSTPRAPSLAGSATSPYDGYLESAQPNTW